MSKSKVNAELALDISTGNNEVHSPADFETALAELEMLVNQMESDQLPLEQSLSSYKRGTELLQFCQKTLAEVEQQVRILNDANQLQPYSDPQ